MLKLLIIASIFWFNPLISNVDVLPDIVGYILVYKAFSKMSYVHEYASDLCKNARSMAIISGLKFLSIGLISSLDPTMSLLLSFSFGIAEAIFGIPFFSKLFCVYYHLAPSEDGQTYSSSENRIARLTIIAFVVRLVLAFLPDLTALSLNNAFTLDTDYTYFRFKPIFIGFSLIVSLTINVVWLIKYNRFIKKVFVKAVIDQCNDSFKARTQNKKSLFVAKENMRVIVFMIIGSIMVIDFSFGYLNVDIFQDAFFTIFASLSFIYLTVKRLYNNKSAFVPLGIVTGVHVASSILENKAKIQYFTKYSYQSMLKVSEAEDMYFSLCTFAIISSLVMVVSVVIVLLILKKNAKQNIVENADVFSQSDISYYLKEFNKRTNKNFVISVTLTALSGIIYSLMVILRPYAEWMILINSIFEVALIVALISYMLYIYDEVYKRILMFS